MSFNDEFASCFADMLTAQLLLAILEGFLAGIGGDQIHATPGETGSSASKTLTCARKNGEKLEPLQIMGYVPLCMWQVP